MLYIHEKSIFNYKENNQYFIFFYFIFKKNGSHLLFRLKYLKFWQYVVSSLWSILHVSSGYANATVRSGNLGGVREIAMLWGEELGAAQYMASLVGH